MGSALKSTLRRRSDTYSRSGADITPRFRGLGPVLAEIPARSAIDCEVVACDASGLPCFRTLMHYQHADAPLCLWAFDLLYLDGVRITPPVAISSARRSFRTWSGSQSPSRSPSGLRGSSRCISVGRVNRGYLSRVLSGLRLTPRLCAVPFGTGRLIAASRNS